MKTWIMFLRFLLVFAAAACPIIMADDTAPFDHEGRELWACSSDSQIHFELYIGSGFGDSTCYDWSNNEDWYARAYLAGQEHDTGICGECGQEFSIDATINFGVCLS